MHQQQRQPQQYQQPQSLNHSLDQVQVVGHELHHYQHHSENPSLIQNQQYNYAPKLKTKRGNNHGPLIAAKAAEMFPSLDRSAKNQSELSLLKLPEINGGQVGGGSMKQRVSGRGLVEQIAQPHSQFRDNQYQRESVG